MMALDRLLLVGEKGPPSLKLRAASKNSERNATLTPTKEIWKVVRLADQRKEMVGLKQIINLVQP
jgi:hypothetical protein